MKAAFCFHLRHVMHQDPGKMWLCIIRIVNNTGKSKIKKETPQSYQLGSQENIKNMVCPDTCTKGHTISELFCFSLVAKYTQHMYH
jgi:hypothetical protein